MTRFARLRLLACLVILAICIPETYAQDPSSTAPRALFKSEDLLDLTLAMDVKAVTRDKSDDRPYRPATLSYLDDAGNAVLLDVGVKTRGDFRLNKLNCRVPPLQLNVKKKQVKNTVFAGQDKIKLITHCKDTFDFSGFINAPYAVPNPGLNLNSVQEQRFMGLCRTEEEFAPVFAVFHRHREAIYALVRNLAPLENKVADRSLAYFDAFYAAIDDPRTVRDAFLGTCLKP